ncbi:MAG: hypothetical protein ACYS8O_00660 [Planctomycetota bacterium]|jgi:hypothetical protein
MKAKMTNVAVLVLIILVSMGCSSSPKVYYGVGKAYARNPETGKIMSWKYKAAEGSRITLSHFILLYALLRLCRKLPLDRLL